MSSINASRAAAFVASAPPSECPARYNLRFFPFSLYRPLITCNMLPRDSHTVSTPLLKPCVSDQIRYNRSNVNNSLIQCVNFSRHSMFLGYFPLARVQNHPNVSPNCFQPTVYVPVRNSNSKGWNCLLSLNSTNAFIHNGRKLTRRKQAAEQRSST